MSNTKIFERGKHGLRATRTFVRSGVTGKKDGDLSEGQIRKLSDSDIETLVKQNVVTVTDGRGAVSADAVEVADGEAEAKKKNAK